MIRHIIDALPERQRTIYLDVSELIRRDAGTGIPRVVREISLRVLQAEGALGGQCEFIYFDFDFGYCMVDRGLFLSQKHDYSFENKIPVEFQRGDVYLGLDLIDHYTAVAQKYFEYMNANGVWVIFLLYDLIPATRPSVFPKAFAEGFGRWVRMVAKHADMVLAISNYTRSQFRNFVKTEFLVERARVEVIRLGGDYTPRGKPRPEPELVAAPGDAPGFVFLMVGTVEPRKGHLQILEVFEALARTQRDIRLEICGRLGWLSEEEQARFGELITCPNVNFRGYTSDRELKKLYASADCLLLGSFDEGYGLPIVEAANHGLPVLARNIEAFKEVGKDSISYFYGANVETIAREIEEFVAKFDREELGRSLGTLRTFRWEDCLHDVQKFLGSLKLPAEDAVYAFSGEMELRMTVLDVLLEEAEIRVAAGESFIVHLMMKNAGAPFALYERMNDHAQVAVELIFRDEAQRIVAFSSHDISWRFPSGTRRLCLTVEDRLAKGKYFAQPKIKIGHKFVDGKYFPVEAA